MGGGAGEGTGGGAGAGCYEAERLVISPGAWAPQLLADLGLPPELTRQGMYWFEPTSGLDPFATIFTSVGRTLWDQTAAQTASGG